MPRARDPLSVYYDDFSAQFLAVLQADLYGWHTATVHSQPGEAVDARGLSTTERAIVRSLYYNLNSTAAEGPLGGRWVKNDEYSLYILRWDDPVYGGGLLARLFRSGPRSRRMIARMTYGANSGAAVPEGQAYTLNPAEQSQALAL